MKKILSFLAAGALALGLIGCPGVLHDKEVVQIDFNDSYYLLGDMTNWEKGDIIKFTKDEADATKFWAKFNATDEKQGFDFAKARTWIGQIGGNNIVAGTLGKDIKYELKDNGFGGVNAVLSGLVKGNTYKMVAYANAEGKVAVDVAESKEPKYFLLDGYYLKGSFNKDWALDTAKVLMNPSKDTATGDVTYQVQFIATETSHEACISQFNTSNVYKGVTVKEGDEPKVLSFNPEKAENIKFSNLEVGKGYFVTVVTSVDETVKISIKEAASVSIVGVQIVGLTTDKTEMTIGGDFNSWPKWDKPNTKIVNGVATLKLAEPKKLFASYTTNIVGYLGDWDNTVIKSTIGGGDNGSVTFKGPFDYKNYIIYADVTGLKEGDSVKWTLVHPTVTVEVTGLPEALNGKELYCTGAFNGWIEPAKEGTTKVTVKDGKVSAVVNIPENTFEGKFAAAGWKTPEITSVDGGNIKVENISFGDVIKLEYVRDAHEKYCVKVVTE